MPGNRSSEGDQPWPEERKRTTVKKTEEESERR